MHCTAISCVTFMYYQVSGQSQNTFAMVPGEISTWTITKGNGIPLISNLVHLQWDVPAVILNHKLESCTPLISAIITDFEIRFTI